jgi:hypothetical protein
VLQRSSLHFLQKYWVCFRGGCRLPDIHPDILAEMHIFTAALVFSAISVVELWRTCLAAQTLGKFSGSTSDDSKQISKLSRSPILIGLGLGSAL